MSVALQDPVRTHLRELDSRTSDGIDVTIYWNTLADDITLDVQDHKNNEFWFVEHIEPANAMFALHHPFAVIGSRSC